MQGGGSVCVSFVLLAAFLLSGANAQISCSGTEVRLLNGFNSSEGQVGICSNGVFRQVCSTGFDMNDAHVICSELGYSEMNPKVFTSNSPYGQGVNSGYAFTNFGCGGMENSLNSCSKTNTSSCFQVVGVDCFPCNAGDVRLENETTPGTGRVQFCSSSGVWSSVCDDSWSTSDAKVLCKQLGYSQLTAQAFGSGTHGDAYFPGVVGGFICNETESTISDCSYNTSASCSASDVASVQCTAKGLCESAGHTTCCSDACGIFSVSPTCYCDTLCLVFNDCCSDFDLTCQPSPGTQCTNGDLRLSQNFTGRVEFCVSGTYGTVCEKGWDNIEAKVVCTQLGYGTSGVSVPGGNFPQVAVPFVATNFACTGSESMLSSCSYDTTPGLLDCGHQQDAAVKCPEPCTGNSLQLAGGTSVYNGRLEVCLNGYYGTVCQGDWSVVDATVVCRQLGYSTFGVQAYGNAYYGQGVGPIHYTNVSCDGTESMLSSCGLSLNPSCNHSMDVGVYCDGVPTLCENNGYSGCCTSGSCSLSNSGSTCYCDSTCHTYNDCCPGIDKTCPSSPVPANCTTGSIRLVEGQNIRQGRLEVCLNGQWTSVCDNGWDNSDAQVVCGQLGFGAAGGTAVSGGLFGQSSFPVGSEGYQCTGTESSLTSCPYSTSSTCSHHQDAGVICLDSCPTEGAVQLVGGTGNSSGFVQICRNNVWGYVCDYNWCSNDADVLCTQLGYSPNRAEAYGASYFGQALGQIHYTNFQCGGSETSLNSCAKTLASTDNCTFTELAGVQCFEQGQCESAGHTDCCTGGCNAGGCFCDSACYTFGDCCDNIENTCPISCTTGDTRLVGGDDDNGRLEICTDGKWGTVCSDQFDYNDAIVICRQLNKAQSGANVETDLSFGQGILPIRISNFGCAGNETNYQSCSYDTSGFCCGHHQVVGVRCPPQCTVGDIRLVNGTNQYEGRLEVCVNGDWATVCDNTFSTAVATVACKQLGFSAVNAQAFGQAYFGQGTGPIGVASTMCTGDEIAATNCSFSLDTSGCTHANDAGVRCSGEVGPCESIGHTTCCVGGGCSPPGTSCYCDSICHVFGDCCTDAIDKTCPQEATLTSYLPQPVSLSSIQQSMTSILLQQTLTSTLVQPITSTSVQPMTSTLVQQPMTSTPVQHAMTPTFVQQSMTSTPVQQLMTFTPVQQPMTSTPVQQPITSASVQQPMTSTPVQQPMTSTPVQQLMTSTPVQQPMTSTFVQQPMTSTSVQQSITSSPVQQSMTSTPVQSITSSPVQQSMTSTPVQPITSTPVQQPITSTFVQQPITSASVQQPMTSTSVQQSMTSIPVQQPITSTSVQQSMTSTPVQQPMTSTSVQQPMTSTPVQQPITSVPVQQPITSTPVQQSMTSTPVQQPMTSTPVQQPMTSTPVQQPITSTPVQQPITSTPVQQPITSTFVQQPMTSTSVQQSMTSTPVQPMTSTTVHQPMTSTPVQQPITSTFVQQPMASTTVTAMLQTMTTIRIQRSISLTSIQQQISISVTTTLVPASSTHFVSSTSLIMSSAVSSTPQPILVSTTTSTSETPTTKPADADSNQVTVTLGGLTVNTFTADKKQAFQQAIADIVNMYCRSKPSDCQETANRRRQATNVQPSDVVITGIMDTSSGLRVQFYVLGTRGGVIPKQAVAAAIQAYIGLLNSVGFTVIDVQIGTPPAELSTGALAGIVIGVIVAVLLVVFSVMMVSFFCWFRYKNHGGMYAFTKKSEAMENTYATSSDIALRNETYTSESEDYVSIHSLKLKDVEVDDDAIYAEITALAEKAM